jgi:hypothetical protein
MIYSPSDLYGGDQLDPPEYYEKPEREYDENLTDRFDGDDEIDEEEAE